MQNKKEYLSNEAGTCPLCGGKDLDYGASYVEDNDLNYPWECKECKATGVEYYTVEFSSHGRVKTVDGEEISNEDGY
ncbi:MAG: hypothetical protein FWD58_06200 [Firmicutes bacterium]|nr:hypothetical protein [Bacillota bacterium]